MVSKPEILRFIAQHEPLEETRAKFPGISRAAIAELLEAVAQALDGAKPSTEVAKTPPSAGGKRVRVYSDGAARGNPGPAGAGAVLMDGSGRVVERVGRFLGKQTNNHAEYMGLILGLEAARNLGMEEVEVYADSQLLIRQLEGRYQVKSQTLRPLFQRARKLLEGFQRVSLAHVPREENTAADEMSNRAIDERL